MALPKLQQWTVPQGHNIQCMAMDPRLLECGEEEAAMTGLAEGRNRGSDK